MGFRAGQAPILAFEYLPLRHCRALVDLTARLIQRPSENGQSSNPWLISVRKPPVSAKIGLSRRHPLDCLYNSACKPLSWRVLLVFVDAARQRNSRFEKYPSKGVLRQNWHSMDEVECLHPDDDPEIPRPRVQQR